MPPSQPTVEEDSRGMATQFRILGPVEALVDRRPATLGAPKQRALLALLLVNRRRVVPAEQLIDGLWGEEPPASALQSLQVYVHGLRRALGSERIETTGRGYRAVVAEEELDLDRFERTLERGRAALEAGRAEDAADDLREALAIWRGSPLAGLPEEARRAAEAERLEELRLTALELRYDAELASGRHDAVVAELETLTSEHPYRERFLQTLSRSIATPAASSPTTSASSRAPPCRNWSARSCSRTRGSPLRRLRRARHGRCRSRPRRSSAAGSSWPPSVRCSATKGRGSSRSRAPEEPGRHASGSRSRRRSSPSCGTGPSSSASRPFRARSCSFPRSPRRSTCERASGRSPRT